MSWFKVDDRLPTSRKMLRIPRSKRTAAIGLWTIAGAWSAHDLTDGFVPAFMIEEWGGTEGDADELIRAGMWAEDEHDGDPGYQFVNWDEYQPMKVNVEAKREYERERKRQQRRDASGKFAGEGNVPDLSHRDNAGTPTVGDRDSTVPVPSRPVPSRERDGHETPILDVSDGKPSSSPSRRKPSKAIPNDWAPSPSHVEKCAAEHIDLEHEAEKFRNNALAKDMRYANWDRAFTNWLSREWVKKTATGIDPMKDW